MQIAAEQAQQHRLARQIPVPGHLERSVEGLILFGEPRHFIEDDDGRCLGDQVVECSEESDPVLGRERLDAAGLLEAGFSDLGEERRIDSADEAPLNAVK